MAATGHHKQRVKPSKIRRKGCRKSARLTHANVWVAKSAAPERGARLRELFHQAFQAARSLALCREFFKASNDICERASPNLDGLAFSWMKVEANSAICVGNLDEALNQPVGHWLRFSGANQHAVNPNVPLMQRQRSLVRSRTVKRYCGNKGALTVSTLRACWRFFKCRGRNTLNS